MIQNEKGQAFFEFVLILPIIVLLLIGVLSIGMFFVEKIELENKVADTIQMWQSQYSTKEELEALFKKEDLKVSISENTITSFITIQVEKTVPLLLPIQIKGTVKVKRVIPLE